MTAGYNVSGNTFGHYPGLAVGVDSGYPYAGYVGKFSNLTIANNVMNEYGAHASGSSFAETPDIILHSFASSTLTNVAIKYNSFNMSSSGGHGYAIVTNGLLGSGISVDHNLIKGSGSVRPLAGIKVISPDAATRISVTNNEITGFATGVQADALPTGASVSASQNCISGNTTGASAATTGGIIAASHNWWGAANGPKPAGSGNAATGKITTTSFLTKPATICAGPIASGVAASPSPSFTNSNVLLSGHLSDSKTGGFTVTSAQFEIDGDTYKAMFPNDGSFNSVTETAYVHITSLTAGTHTFCVRGVDSAGNIGAASCVTQTVKAQAAASTTTPTATGTPGATATDTPTAAATDTPTTAPVATDTPSTGTGVGTDSTGGASSGGSSSEQ